MRVCNLSSGSTGNVTYIETSKAKVLLDAGLSARDITNRLALLQILPEQIDAILITHEHSDHIKGVDVLASKYHIPVYVHTKGYWALIEKLKKSEQIKFIQFDDLDFYIKDLKVTSFELSHDAEYCCGFSFVENTKKVSILTDLGYTSSEVLSKIVGSTLVYLEANHDEEMLEKNVNYPLMTKQRIRGNCGHLSNMSAAKVIEILAKTGTKQVMLSHISRENNTPELAYSTICKYLREHGIIEGEHIRIATTSINPSYLFKID